MEQYCWSCGEDDKNPAKHIASGHGLSFEVFLCDFHAGMALIVGWGITPISEKEINGVDEEQEQIQCPVCDNWVWLYDGNLVSAHTLSGRVDSPYCKQSSERYTPQKKVRPGCLNGQGG
jgi:hypothetical protein